MQAESRIPHPLQCETLIDVNIVLCQNSGLGFCSSGCSAGSGLTSKHLVVDLASNGELLHLDKTYIQKNTFAMEIWFKVWDPFPLFEGQCPGLTSMFPVWFPACRTC